MKFTGSFLLLILAFQLSAQYNRLVTPSDGASVVFSSSLSLQSDATHDWPKLFEATTAGVRLLEERLPASPPPLLPTQQTFYQLWSRDQSSDGVVQTLNTVRPCIGGSRCVFVEQSMAELSTASWADSLKRGGTLRLSADGHYAFNYGSSAAISEPAVLDLWTNTVTRVPARPDRVAAPGRRVIANNGLAVYVNPYVNDTVMLASRDGVLTVAKTSMPASSAIIENQGRYLVYETAATPHQLMLYDVAAEADLPLVWAEEGCTQPALSDDGLRLLFLSAANWAAENDQLRVQAWLFDLITGELQQLTHDTAGLAEATLSGDGQVVWAVTLAGRLLRIDVDALDVTEVVGRTVAIDAGQMICLQSQQCVLMGRGLASRLETAADPLPFTLGGIEVKIDGIPVPLISVAPDEIRYVLPWAIAPGQHRVEVTPGASVFQEKNVLITSQVN
ncbi:MAG: hypothetical protein IPP47_32210 [Bryobacterales bacterium]|nr:hypothetical protein [Bryobacterales bacterium]